MALHCLLMRFAALIDLLAAVSPQLPVNRRTMNLYRFGNLCCRTPLRKENRYLVSLPLGQLLITHGDTSLTLTSCSVPLSVVGYLSPFNHECRTYYLNSRYCSHMLRLLDINIAITAIYRIYCCLQSNN